MDWSSCQFHAFGPCTKLAAALPLPFLLGYLTVVAGALLLGVATRLCKSTAAICLRTAALAAFRIRAASLLALIVALTSRDSFACLAVLRRHAAALLFAMRSSWAGVSVARSLD